MSLNVPVLIIWVASVKRASCVLSWINEESIPLAFKLVMWRKWYENCLRNTGHISGRAVYMAPLLQQILTDIVARITNHIQCLYVVYLLIGTLTSNEIQHRWQQPLCEDVITHRVYHSELCIFNWSNGHWNKMFVYFLFFYNICVSCHVCFPYYYLFYFHHS